MCGIVGYVGPRRAAPVLLDGLRKLEYRGYDSAGVAIADGTNLWLGRSVGKLDNLVRIVEERAPQGQSGIGHTRWATHGRPSEENAHPHLAGDVAVVHNGIIENYLELKHDLEHRGVRFSSETDTEIVAHLIEEAHATEPLAQAVRRALERVRGAYALAVVSKREPGKVVVAKYASPLVLGIAEHETLCASDIPALIAHTRDVIFLEDGEIATLSAEGAEILSKSGEPVTRSPKRIDWNPTQAEKGGHKHFMLKEILEQPRAIEDTLRGRIRLEEGDVVYAELGLDPEHLKRVRRVVFVACGTSYHAASVGRYYMEQLARVPTQAELASEVRYRGPVFLEDDLVVAVSQSGETADTLAAAQAAREAGAMLLAIANVPSSAIPRLADGALYTHAGPEIGVASTKCFTTQLVATLLLAIGTARSRGALGAAEAQSVLQALVEVPQAMRRALGRRQQVFDVARTWHGARHMLFLGRGLCFPIALEGALKLKEISYAHAEGYAAGEMKHGPIALIDEDMPVVVVMPKDRHHDKTLANLAEVRARDGRVIAVLTDGDEQARKLAQFSLFIPQVPEVVVPLVAVLPLQLLAYYVADIKGTDVDQPRNLAKTVTVE